MKPPTPRTALIIAAVMALAGSILFFAVLAGPDFAGGFVHSYLIGPIMSLFNGNSPDTASDHIPDNGLEAAYLYKDRHGIDHIVFEPPKNFDYQVIYIPKMTDAQKREHYGRDIADDVRRFLRGGAPQDNGGAPPEPDSDPYRDTGVSPRENHDLPRTPAADILSASNNLRQNTEKTKNPKKHRKPNIE